MRPVIVLYMYSYKPIDDVFKNLTKLQCENLCCLIFKNKLNRFLKAVNYFYL